MKTKPKSQAQAAKDSAEKLPEPVDSFQGIPDCAPRVSRKRWALMVLLFAGWIAFLVYCWLAGRLPAN